MILELQAEEVAVAKEVTLEIMQQFNQKDLETYKRTFNGIMAEIAGLRFFNDCLGHTPLLKLNRDYSNNGDGGFDFKFPDAKTLWDVKSTTKDYFIKEHLTKTKAHFILAVQKLKKRQFEIIGFCPVNRIKTEKIDFSFFSSNFKDLMIAYPNILSKGKSLFLEQKEPEKLGKLLPRAINNLNF
jgi:hypothetical protein